MASNVELIVNKAKEELMAALRQHALDDRREFDEGSKRFDRVFEKLKSMDDKSDERDEKRDQQTKAIINKVETLWDKNSRQEGAFGLGKWVAGGIGGLVVAIISWMAK